MSALGAFAKRRSHVGVVALTVLLVFGWFAYRPALTGTFLLDDFDNLDGLSQVGDVRSAMHFVLSGIGGPTGRPLAMLSFLPQASHWDDSASPFILVNVVIHLFNGLLLYLFVRQLGRQLRMEQPDVEFLALSITALWIFMPLLASASLMIVQRMTTLSASFVLAGLNLYLYARNRIQARPRVAIGGMSAALLVATPLAILSKENGVLLPAFVLVLEATLLSPPTSVPKLQWRIWAGVFLVLPTAIIVVYLASYAVYPEHMVLRRDFNGWERLLSEARIMWEYLFNAFIARPGQFSPFHDAYPVSRSLLEPATILAAVSWIALAVCSVVWRRKYPLVAFAVLWYLAGHLLESTTLPLELYFEHRNYLPIIGPIVALALAAARVGGDYRKYARSAIMLYALINAAILLAVTSNWGKPLQAASFWFINQPASVRAATNLAARQLEEMGPQTALITLREFADAHPQHGYIRIPALTVACGAMPESHHASSLELLESDLSVANFSYTTVTMLDQLLTAVASGTCDGVKIADVERLANTVLENPVYGGRDQYRQLHHKLMARIARLSGDRGRTLKHLAMAVDYSRDDDLNMMMVTTLVLDGQYDAARGYVESARKDLPAFPLRRLGSNLNLEGLARYIDEAERLGELREPKESN